MQNKSKLLALGLAATTLFALVPQSANAGHEDRFYHYHNGVPYNKAAVKHHYKKHRRCNRGYSNHYGHSYSKIYYGPYGKRVVHYSEPYYGHHYKKKVKHHYTRHYSRPNSAFVVNLDFD